VSTAEKELYTFCNCVNLLIYLFFCDDIHVMYSNKVLMLTDELKSDGV